LRPSARIVALTAARPRRVDVAFTDRTGRVSVHGSHALARFGAARALLGAGPHARVVIHLGARIGAPPADDGAGAARVRVQVGAAHHEIGTRLTDLGAVQHQPHVVRLDVLTAHLQAVR
jgi:hypothetical protein